MSTLANLTNEECQLLVELLERQQEEAKSQRGDQTAPQPGDDQTHRKEVLERLLWHAHMGCATPTPNDAELREIGSYA